MAKKKKQTAVERKCRGYIAARRYRLRGKLVAFVWEWHVRPQAKQVWAAICDKPDGCEANSAEIVNAKRCGWIVLPLRTSVSIPVDGV